MAESLDIHDWQELLLVAAAIELDIFRELAQKPADAGELARRLDYDSRSVRIVLAALEDLGHVEKKKGRYRTSAQIRSLAVDQESPDYAPYSILHRRNLIERWLTIPAVVRSGKQVERAYTKERRMVFVHSMNDVSRRFAGAIVNRCLRRAPDARSVIDIGGGPGIYGREFAKHCLKVTIYDRPEVLKITRSELSDVPELNFASGDFNQKIPAGPFDVAFMSNIFHIYGPEENLKLLRRVHASLAPGGIAAIVDSVRGLSPRAPLFAVTMLVNTDTGDTWTEDDYLGWLRQAGFENISIEDVQDNGRQLILANKAR